MPTDEKIRTEHAVNLLKNLERLRHSKWKWDYKIRSDRKFFKVHKTVLAGCSETLQNMVERGNSQIQFAIGPETTRQVIKFMYSGTAKVTEKNFKDFVLAAQTYGLDGLKALCLNYVDQNLNAKNCLQWVEENMSSKFDDTGIITKFIEDHFDEVIDTDEFKNLTGRELSSLLKDLQLPSHQLWHSITTWVQHDTYSGKLEMNELVEENLNQFSPETILNEMLQCDLLDDFDGCKKMLLEHVLSTPEKFKREINARNCFFLYKLCDNSPESCNALSSRDNIMEFMIENFAAIEDNEAIMELPPEGAVDLCQGIGRKKNSGRKTWKLALKWTKHKRGERQNTFPQLFSCVNLYSFSHDFVANFIWNEELVKSFSECKDRVSDHWRRKVCAYESSKKRRRIETPSEEQSLSVSRISHRTNRPYIALYDKDSGSVFGFDLSVSKKSKTGKLPLVKETLSQFTVKTVSDDFQVVFTLGEDLYFLKGEKLQVQRVKGSKKGFKKSWKGRKPLQSKPTSNAKVVPFQGKLYMVETRLLIIYDPESDCWSHKEMPKITGKRFAVCANSTNLYVLGGDITPRRALEYSPETPTRKISLTVNPRVDSCAVSVGEDLFILGGEDESARRSVERYNKSTQNWTTMQAKMVFCRWSFSACARNGKIYAVGGIKGSSSRNSIEVYDTKTAGSKWTVLCYIPRLQVPFNACIVTLADEEETTPMETPSTSNM